MRNIPECPHGYFPIPGCGLCGQVTFEDFLVALSARVDPHVCQLREWIVRGGRYMVSTYAWNVDARNGRFTWGPSSATYCSGVTPMTYVTGGMDDEFNRRIALMLEQTKFELLTSHVNVVTREQYMTAWRMWAQFCACSDISPWITGLQPGWGINLINFLVWGRKLLGLQHSTLSKRFYAIGFVHIAEGYDDFSSRAHRARGFLKATKLGGEPVRRFLLTPICYGGYANN